MDYNQFIERVQEYSGSSKEDSLRIVSAVLETLGERLLEKHREHLATQLPKELKPFVLRRGKNELLSLESFYVHVSSRAGLSFHEAIKHSRNVLRIIQEAVAEGELRDIFAEIPPEYDELLGRKPSQISPTTVDVHELFKPVP